MAPVRVNQTSLLRSDISWQTSPPQRWKRLLLVSCLNICALGCSRCGGSGASGTQPPPQNPAPTLSALNPNTAAIGGAALTMRVSGTGFISESVIQ